MRLNRCLTSKDCWSMSLEEFNRHARNELKRYARRWLKKEGFDFDKEHDKIIIKMINTDQYVICIYNEGVDRYILWAKMERDGFNYKGWEEIEEVDKQIIVGRLIFPNRDLW